MKKLKNLIAILTLSVLAGCSKFSDGTSVFQGGLWLVPTLTALGAAIFGYQAYKGSKSGSNLIEAGATTPKEGGNVPIWKFGQFWFSVTLIVATLIILVAINGDK